MDKPTRFGALALLTAAALRRAAARAGLGQDTIDAIESYFELRRLHGGYGEWKARGGLEAHARAARQRN